MRRLGIAALIVAVIATLAILIRDSRETTAPLAHQRFTISLPDSALDAVSPEARIPVAQISPDGRRVAFIVRSVSGRLASRIWLQRLDDLHADEISGSEGALSLFWAPDSEHLGFFTRGAVKKLRVSNGLVQTLCDACEPAGYGSGTWSRSGLILFPSEQDGRLLGIRDGGGEPEAITSVDRSLGELRHMSPWFLPDGHRFLYVIRNVDASRSGLYVGQVGSAEPRLLFQGEQPAIYAAPGYLLFNRAGHLVARPFDLARLEFSGDPIPLFPLDYRSAPAPVSVSETGVLTHAIVEYPRMQFQWVSRTTGELQRLVMEPGDYRSFDLSPDGRWLAFTRAGDRNMSLWVHDLEQGLTPRWTFGDTAHTDPRWTKDSQQLLATRWQPEPQGIVQVLANGSESVVSTAVEPSALDDVSLDGKYLLYRHRGLQLLAKPLGEGSEADVVRKAPSGVMDQAQFSPNTRWIAYNANETGQFEVYVTPFPARGERQLVSSGGGVQPVWRNDGRELYYLGLNGMLHAVELRPDGERLQPSVRQLFQTGLAAPSPNIEQYAASPDGQRFLILKPVDNKVRSSIGVVLNWPALLTAAKAR